MANVNDLLVNTIRNERGRIVAGLVRYCGNIDICEEAFQEAALAAINAWRTEVPANPGAWLMTTAKNSARDAWRRRQVVAQKAELLDEAGTETQDSVDTIEDNYLRLICTCCHPDLSVDNQIPLTLKVVAGFSVGEIARALVCSEATASQRILRAKQILTEKHVPYGVPDRSELSGRVVAVLGVIYSMYNEGHTTHSGPLMRLDLQGEALRLAKHLSDCVPDEPELFGLIALIAFGVARAKTRVDNEGVPILLPQQDRALWNKEFMREGFMALGRARTLGNGRTYVLQAEIAAVHMMASTWQDTDWARILALYDALDELSPSPVVKLNRAIALSMRLGPAAGLRALDELTHALMGYHLFYAMRADLVERCGDDPTDDLRQAIALATNDGERRLLEQRLANVQLNHQA
jgi:RNA polymerase sigma-70 factor, ECF subfamily